MNEPITHNIRVISIDRGGFYTYNGKPADVEIRAADLPSGSSVTFNTTDIATWNVGDVRRMKHVTCYDDCRVCEWLVGSWCWRPYTLPARCDDAEGDCSTCANLDDEEGGCCG